MSARRLKKAADAAHAEIYDPELFITNDEKKHEISLFVPGIGDEIILSEKEVKFLSTVLPDQIRKWK